MMRAGGGGGGAGVAGALLTAGQQGGRAGGEGVRKPGGVREARAREVSEADSTQQLRSRSSCRGLLLPGLSLTLFSLASTQNRDMYVCDINIKKRNYKHWYDPYPLPPNTDPK